MNIIEQLKFEKKRVSQMEGYKNDTNLINYLNNAIDKIEKEGKTEILRDENFYMRQETNGDTLYESLCGYVCSKLEQDNGEKEFPHWINLFGEAVVAMEEEINHPVIITRINSFSAYDLLLEMVDQGEISMMEDGTVRRNPYRLIQKVEKYQVKQLKK